ncbi:hypothetical protein E8E13_004272 [Curvularia kusanoi]|uniref:Actin-like ATPase domain-containing protein n=1 Tax=Curvularia kusanoi TaxID=90978 RepID=A0A9P4WAS5_CURKU|nr:hypothetical protein E8E13_004272 [Curvularia kusanoi]
MCDMGGGTVDLISYRVNKVHPVAVEEVTIGCGDQCGGSFVDRAFLKWLEMKLGTHNYLKISACRSEDMPRTSLSSKLARMLQDFTLEVKSGFSGTETNHIRLPYPLNSMKSNKARGISEGELRITPEDMITMFEFPLRRTYELLGEQLQKAKQIKNLRMKYVFMVGGFTGSPYMSRKVTEFVETAGLQAIRPAYPWSAVARGAVCKALEGNVKAITNRKCRRHYGVSIKVRFDPSEHEEDEWYICEFEYTKWVDGLAMWLLNKGDDLQASESSHTSMTFNRNFWPEQKTIKVSLYSSEQDEAPQRIAHESVKKIASIVIDLSVVPVAKWQTKFSPSEYIYYAVNFSLKISIESALMFSLWIDGVCYGFFA